MWALQLIKLKATYGQTQGDYITYHNYDTTSLPVRDLIFVLWNIQKSFAFTTSEYFVAVDALFLHFSTTEVC